MVVFLVIIGVIVALCCSAVIAYQFSSVAAYKGHISDKYFWFCFLFGIAGYLLVIALPDVRTKKETVKEFELPKL